MLLRKNLLIDSFVDRFIVTTQQQAAQETGALIPAKQPATGGRRRAQKNAVTVTLLPHFRFDPDLVGI
jgi:hypothetical protein